MTAGAWRLKANVLSVLMYAVELSNPWKQSTQPSVRLTSTNSPFFHHSQRKLWICVSKRVTGHIPKMGCAQHPENGMLPSICAVHFYTHQCNLAAPQPLKAIVLKDECLHIFPNLSFIMTWTCVQVQWSWAMTAKFSPWTWTQQHCKKLTSNILWQTVHL